MISNFDLPTEGDAIPRRGNRLMRSIARLVLKLGGWQASGQLPNLPKFVIAGAPHTSYWDALWAVAFIFSMGLDFHWMAKKEAFVPPFGSILRWLGGIPVDRDAPRGLVQQVIDQFKARDQFVLVITPEGTRKKVARWKSGFYRIAVAADVPIVLGYADYPKRIIGFGPAIYPSGNLEADMEKILAFYAMITPRHPHRA